jgi:hypothetical protein
VSAARDDRDLTCDLHAVSLAECTLATYGSAGRHGKPVKQKLRASFSFGDLEALDRVTATIAPTPGKEFWASFLLFHSGPNDQTFMGLAPPGTPLGALPSAAIGVRLGQYGIFDGATFIPSAKPFTPPGSTDLLVAQFVAGGGGWTVSLFVNPTSFGVPDVIAVLPPVVYATMVNQNQAEFESDEFRLGDTAGDVSAVGVVPTGNATWGGLKAHYR